MKVEFQTVALPAPLVPPPVPPPVPAQWVSECQVCFTLVLNHQTEGHRRFHQETETLHDQISEAYDRAMATGEVLEFARSLIDRIERAKAATG